MAAVPSQRPIWNSRIDMPSASRSFERSRPWAPRGVANPRQFFAASLNVGFACESAFAFTISRAAEILGEDEAAPAGLSRRDGSGGRLPLDLWHRGSADDCLHARLNGISERACSRSTNAIGPPPAVLNGWFQLTRLLNQLKRCPRAVYDRSIEESFGKHCYKLVGT